MIHSFLNFKKVFIVIYYCLILRQKKNNLLFETKNTENILKLNKKYIL